MNLPDIGTIKKIIKEWAENHPRITKVHVFGSYVKKNKPVIEDIDIAIEISYNENDTPHGYWCGEASEMKEQLSKLLNYKVDLEWSDGERTKIIKKGLEEGSVLIYEKSVISS